MISRSPRVFGRLVINRESVTESNQRKALGAVPVAAEGLPRSDESYCQGSSFWVSSKILGSSTDSSPRTASNFTPA